MKTPIARVQDLMRLAVNEATSLEERRTAALKAVSLMAKHDLVVVGSTDIDEWRKQVSQLAERLARAEDRGFFSWVQRQPLRRR